MSIKQALKIREEAVKYCALGLKKGINNDHKAEAVYLLDAFYKMERAFEILKSIKDNK